MFAVIHKIFVSLFFNASDIKTSVTKPSVIKLSVITASVLIVGLSVIPPVGAEVYRWTDENGKVHFGDRAPQNAPVEDVTEQAKAVNIDSSSEQLHTMERLYPKDDPNDKPRPSKSQLQKHKLALKHRCDQARSELEIYTSIPFYYQHQNGSFSTISSLERDRRADELKKDISKYCKG